MSRRPELIALVLLVLIATGCGAVRGDRVESGMSTSNADSRIETSLPAQRDVGDATLVDHVERNGAFAFTAFELSTRAPLFGEDLVRQGQVVVTFVVPSCPVCVEEGPQIARSASENPDVTYVIVHSGGTVEAYEQYVESSGLALDNVVHLDDSPGLLWSRFGIVQQPSNILVDADGGVSQSLGALGEKGLKASFPSVGLLRKS